MRHRFHFHSIGIVSRAAIFIWSLGMVMLTADRFLPLAAALCLGAAGLVYPRALKRTLFSRWLILLGVMILPPIFFMGARDLHLWGIGYSGEGLRTAAQIALRFVVALTAADGFTAAVDISALAGLLERIGLHGLGFSLGVAFNLLPALRQSGVNAWQSLWMRGGLRRQRWRGLQLLFTTIIANALKRAEEIALAAETRAFSPEKFHPVPVNLRPADIYLSIGLLIVLAGFMGWR
jgi:energy-coupling factor transporter transmembrane protein EcfT